MTLSPIDVQPRLIVRNTLLLRALTPSAAVLQLITITDGEPTNEPERKIFQVVKHVKDFMSQTPYGPSAIAFEFAQARDATSATDARHSNAHAVVSCLALQSADQYRLLRSLAAYCRC